MVSFHSFPARSQVLLHTAYHTAMIDYIRILYQINNIQGLLFVCIICCYRCLDLQILFLSFEKTTRVNLPLSYPLCGWKCLLEYGKNEKYVWCKCLEESTEMSVTSFSNYSSYFYNFLIQVRDVIVLPGYWDKQVSGSLMAVLSGL